MCEFFLRAICNGGKLSRLLSGKFASASPPTLTTQKVASGQSRTIFDSGDVICVELSDDSELAAFLRRPYFKADGFDRHEQSALCL